MPGPITIPLGLQSYDRRDAFMPAATLVNMFIEKDPTGSSEDSWLRLQRPGLAYFRTVGTGPKIRGMYQSDGVAEGRTIVVTDDKVYAVEPGAATLLGTVAFDNASARFAAFFTTLYIASAGNLYYIDGNDGSFNIVAIPDANNPLLAPQRQVVDIVGINDYIMIAMVDGTIYWIKPGEHEIDPLSFENAETNPDGIVGMAKLLDSLYVFGTRSIEVWEPTGDANLPFQRAQGRNLQRGCMYRDSIQLLDNTLFFVGNNGVVYRCSNVPERVSTFAIEEAIRDGTNRFVTAIRYQVIGHEFYCLKVAGQGTFAFDASTQSWSELQSSSLAGTGFIPWLSVDTPYGTLLGSQLDGTIYRFDHTRADDFGTPLYRAVSGTIPLMSRRATRNQSVSLFVSSSAACSYRFQYHDGDGRFQTPALALPALLGPDVLAVYRLGASSGSFRTFLISINDPVMVRISAMTVNGSSRDEGPPE